MGFIVGRTPIAASLSRYARRRDNDRRVCHHTPAIRHININTNNNDARRDHFKPAPGAAQAITLN